MRPGSTSTTSVAAPFIAKPIRAAHTASPAVDNLSEATRRNADDRCAGRF
jgi:hypothetical protein